MKTLNLILQIIFFLPAFYFTSIFSRKKRKTIKKPRLVFGPTPIINNKYWSTALREAGFESTTLMKDLYIINKKEDFDLYYNDKKFNLWSEKLRNYWVFLFVLKNFDIVHLPFDGGFLAGTPFRWMELYFYKLAGIKTIMLTYGSDHYIYSRLTDQSLKHALLISYPDKAVNEENVRKQVDFFNKYADFVITGHMIEGTGRWDILPFNHIVIDENLWPYIEKTSLADGKLEPVKIIHTPNHRGAKGTEFLIKTVEELQQEGYKIELTLLERMPNEKVKELMQKSDILVEQLIIPAYGLSAIEGMSTGLPVLANLTVNSYTTLFKRYSYLTECPVVPTNPENIKENLKKLIETPKLRLELGHKGRTYAEKYHSKKTAQIMFSRIYDKIWYNKEMDLINFFHPLSGQYYKDYEILKSPADTRVSQ